MFSIASLYFDGLTEEEKTTLRNVFFLGFVRDNESIIATRKTTSRILEGLVEKGWLSYDKVSKPPKFCMTAVGADYLQKTFNLTGSRSY